MSPEQPPTKIGKSVGEKLRAARLAQNYTQSQLAAPDFSVSYISAIERGQIHPSLRALEILASRLGLTSTDLFPSHPQPEEYLQSPVNLAKQDEDEIALMLLQAHVLILHDYPAEAIAKLDTVATKDLQPPLLLQLRYLQGLIYFKTDQLQQSEDAFCEAEYIAKSLHANYFLLHILNHLALTYTAMQNFAQASQIHQRCIELIEGNEHVDPLSNIQVYASTGDYHMQLGNLDQAIAAFNKALLIADQYPTSYYIQAVYADFCHYYIMAKNQHLANLYAYKSRQIHFQHKMRQLKIHLHHYLGHALMQKDPHTARDYIVATLQKPDILKYRQAQASLITRKAEWHFAQQELDEAEFNARQAHALVQTFGDTIVNAETLIMLGHIEYAQGRYTDGSQQLLAGLDMLERLQNYEELADASVRYAQLLENIGKEHEAFIYFRRAFESRQKLDFS